MFLYVAVAYHRPGVPGLSFAVASPVSVLGVADLEWLKVFGSTVFIGLYAATIDVTRAR
jgi:hypothetical protein